ncbi:MAG: NUDIX hydrolase [Mariniblastus sp.]|nr:NUDIX hydrolase [Mariniblastus sp.]
MSKNKNDLQLIAETPFLRLVQRERWSFAQRPQEISVVAIVAVTHDNKLVLVEQYRPPTDSRVIELPAGLAGDISGKEDETLQTAAARELLEETGYTAENWKQLATVVSSAGLTDEKITVFLASTLTKAGEGGGDESEDITVHEIPLDQAEHWLAEQAKNHRDIDGRVFAALHWAKAV